MPTIDKLSVVIDAEVDGFKHGIQLTKKQLEQLKDRWAEISRSMAQNANWIDSKSFTEIQNKAKDIYSLFKDNEITLMADDSEIDSAAYNAEDLDKALSGVESKANAAVKPLEEIRNVLENIKTVTIGEYFEKFESVFGQWQKDLIQAHDKINNIKSIIADFEKHNIPIGDLNEKLIEAEGHLNDIRNNMTEATGLSTQLAAIWETILTDENIDPSMKLVDRFRLSLDQLAAMKTQLVGVNTELEKAQTNADKLKGSFSKSISPLKKMSKQIFKIGLAFAGIRSAYTAIRRAMSTYLSQNEELNNKLNACWYALGSLFAPILEWIVNLFVKLLNVINAIVVGLGGAGINMKNFGKATASAAKEQKKLAGFDEINDIGSDNSGGGSAAFENPFADTDKSNWFLDSIREHAKEILILLGGLALAIAAIKLGFAEWAPIIAGISLVIAGVVSIANDIKRYIDDPSWQNFLAVMIDLGVIIAGLAIAFGALSGVAAVVVAGIAAIFLIFKDDIIAWLADLYDKFKGWMEPFRQWLIDAVLKLMNGIGELWMGLTEVVSNVWSKLKSGAISAWTAMWGGIQNICNSISSGVSNAFTNLKSKVVTGFTDIKTGAVNIFTSMWNTLKGVINSILNGVQGMANGVINGFNGMIRALNNLHINIPSWVPVYGGKSFGLNINQISTITIPKLATGTNYVPEDQLAMIHKGEAVVPKKFNSDTYFEKINNNNNEEVVDALNTLISVVESKEFNAFISQREIGQTAIKYINSQNRIMGGSVI